MTIETSVWIGLSIVTTIMGGCIGWFIAASRLRPTITDLTVRAEKAEALLESERQLHHRHEATTAVVEMRMREAFVTLSNDVLQTTANQSMDRIEATLKTRQDLSNSELNRLLNPLQTSLVEYRQQIVAIEQSRNEAYGGLKETLQRVALDQQRLREETHNLTQALRQPHVRGRWGEMQLKRVIELAGMSDLCDYFEQATTTTREGQQQRPDVRINLPNKRCIIVDAKAPLHAYLEALEAPDEPTRTLRLAHHAKQVRNHVTALASKAYQENIDGTHDFVVLFIPGEVFYNAALEHDHELLEYAFEKKIILANPGTLIGLLKAVALGWQETRLTEHAKEIETLGNELYKRLDKLAEHITTVGSHLKKVTTSYNTLVGSFERNVLTSARRIHELHGRHQPIDPPDLLESPIHLPRHADHQQFNPTDPD